MNLHYFLLTKCGFCAISPKDAWETVKKLKRGKEYLLVETDKCTLYVSKSEKEGVYEVYDLHTEVTNLMYEQSVRCYIATMNKLAEGNNESV